MNNKEQLKKNFKRWLCISLLMHNGERPSKYRQTHSTDGILYGFEKKFVVLKTFAKSIKTMVCLSKKKTKQNKNATHCQIGNVLFLISNLRSINGRTNIHQKDNHSVQPSLPCTTI